MAFNFRPAKREAVNLLIGLAGASGSGKTYSALRLATGLSGGKPFVVLDTENGRANHYAETFRFDHGDIRSPFRPATYDDAIAAADAAEYPVIVVDSMSHEWAGDGGLLDWHDDEVDRMAGADLRKRDAVNVGAWKLPKQEHKRFVNHLLQLRAHLILCFRADQKIEMVRNDQGKIEIREKQSLTGAHGWIPITEKTLPYELTVSLLLTPERPGVPFPIKLQEQHKRLVSLEEPLTEDVGAALGAWAQGGADPAVVAMEWLAKIDLARDRDTLTAIGDDVAKAKLTPAVAKLVRDGYRARLKEFPKPRTAKAK